MTPYNPHNNLAVNTQVEEEEYVPDGHADESTDSEDGELEQENTHEDYDPLANYEEYMRVRHLL